MGLQIWRRQGGELGPADILVHRKENKNKKLFSTGLVALVSSESLASQGQAGWKCQNNP